MNILFYTNYPLSLYTSYIKANSPAYHWINIDKFLMGTPTIIPRSGTFTIPWQIKSPYKFNIPDFSVTENDTIDYLIDKRGQEMYTVAKQQNKKIILLWSGGVDSTAVLVSLLKAIPANEQADMLTICANPDSVLENFSFYRQFISNRLQLVHTLNLNFGDNILNENLVLHGEPGDLLACPNWKLYYDLIKNNKHNLPYANNLTLLYKCHTVPNYPLTCKWYVDKVNANVVESAPEDITTIADWFYWYGINLRWQSLVWSPFCSPSMRSDHYSPISKINTENYYNNIFLNADYLQRWFYQHRREIFLDGTGKNFMYKYFFKNYIYQFDKNQSYFDNKVKVSSISSISKFGMNPNLETIPLYYDQDWVAHTLAAPELHEEILELLKNYSG